MTNKFNTARERIIRSRTYKKFDRVHEKVNNKILIGVTVAGTVAGILLKIL